MFWSAWRAASPTFFAFLLTGFVTVVTWFDIRYRRIPNFLTFPAVFIGLFAHALTRGLDGVWFSFKGLALGLSLLIIPYAVGGMKAGDVKLLAALGAWVGATDVLRIFLATVLCYPLLAIVPVLRAGKLRLTLRRFGRVFFNFLGFFWPGMKLYAMPFAANDDPSIASVRTPYGLAISVGTLIALWTNFLR